MDVSNMYGSIASPSSLGSIGGIDGTSTTSSASPIDIGPAASARISGPGQLFSHLQQLSQQSPGEFHKVASQVASKFHAAASATSGAEAQMLENLANQFTQASQTGSLATPPGMHAGGVGAMGGSHHHAMTTGGGAALLSQSSAAQGAFQSAQRIVDQAMQASFATTGAT